MVCVSLGLTQKDPAAGLRAENIVFALVLQHVGRIVAWSSGAQRQLAEIAKSRQDGPKHRALFIRTGTHGLPSLSDAFPHRVHVVPVLWIFLTKPFPIAGAGHHKIEPERGAVSIRAGIDHMMVDFEFV